MVIYSWDFFSFWIIHKIIVIQIVISILGLYFEISGDNGQTDFWFTNDVHTVFRQSMEIIGWFFIAINIPKYYEMLPVLWLFTYAKFWSNFSYLSSSGLLYFKGVTYYFCAWTKYLSHLSCILRKPMHPEISGGRLKVESL